MLDGKCLIQLLDSDNIFFLGVTGKHVTDMQEAVIFENEYSAYEYIDKHGLYRFAKVRKIVSEGSVMLNRHGN